MSKRQVLDQMERERREEMTTIWIDVLVEIVEGKPIDNVLQAFLLKTDNLEWKTIAYQNSDRHLQFIEIDIAKYLRLNRDIPIDLFSAYAVIAEANTSIKSNKTVKTYHDKLFQELRKKRLEIQTLESEVPLLQKKVEAVENDLQQQIDGFSAFQKLTRSGEFQALQEQKRHFDVQQKLPYLEKSNKLAFARDEIEDLEKQVKVAEQRISSIMQEREENLELWFAPLGLDMPKQILPLTRLPKGKHWRGSYDNPEERPIVKMQLQNDLYVLATPVTQALYMTVMHVNPSFRKNLLRPVEKVTWLDAIMFCNNLSRTLGREQVYEYTMNGDVIHLPSIQQNKAKNGFRLLTELEWESTARGNKPFLYAGNDDYTKVAWTSENSMNKTQTVRRLLANSLGLYDMSGNVYEWCWDWFDQETYQKHQEPDCDGPKTGNKRVIRGGSVSSLPDCARVSARTGISMTAKDSFVGFRICTNTPFHM